MAAKKPVVETPLATLNPLHYQMIQMYLSGVVMEEIATRLERKVGGIFSRLRRVSETNGAVMALMEKAFGFPNDEGC